MRVAGYVAAFIGGVIVCYLLLSLGVVDRLDGVPGTQEEPALSLPTYLSFISVMMTAVTVVLAAVAIFIGIVAAFTFRELSEKAEKAAQKRADEALSDDVIIARIDEIAFKTERTRTLDELEEGFDPTDTGER
ncbi:hypothetical protein MJD09_20565 [bacterium]|nr:hypothetical protein [bacterium]